MPSEIAASRKAIEVPVPGGGTVSIPPPDRIFRSAAHVLLLQVAMDSALMASPEAEAAAAGEPALAAWLSNNLKSLYPESDMNVLARYDSTNDCKHVEFSLYNPDSKRYDLRVWIRLPAPVRIPRLAGTGQYALHPLYPPPLYGYTEKGWAELGESDRQAAKKKYETLLHHPYNNEFLEFFKAAARLVKMQREAGDLRGEMMRLRQPAGQPRLRWGDVTARLPWLQAWLQAQGWS